MGELHIYFQNTSQAMFLFVTTFKLETGGERKVLIAKVCNFSPRAVLILPLPLSLFLYNFYTYHDTIIIMNKSYVCI